MQHVTLLTAEDLAPIQADIQIIKEHLLAGVRPTDDYLNVAQVAALTSTSERTVRKWITHGKPNQKGKLVRLFVIEFSPGYPRVPRSALLAYGLGLVFGPQHLQWSQAAALLPIA